MSEKTNSYKKYYDICEYLDLRANISVNGSEIGKHIGLSTKQALRCLHEIASVDGRYKIDTTNKATTIRRVT